MILDRKNTIERYENIRLMLSRDFEIESPFDFIQIANEGVSAQMIKKIMTGFNFSHSLAAKLLNVSEPTIYRWLRSDKTLDRNISIRLLEITDLFLYGEEVFGVRDKFFKWLSLPNTALGNMEPVELLEFPDGASKVRDIIGRIEFGVYS
ncbi:MAG: hypothetical protein SCALA702_07290 [Melioribacteraceae bacterium]|nr:MAG: hypothetical protein SCALA702_07290 [Melioribacteraceae bacterium]